MKLYEPFRNLDGTATVITRDAVHHFDHQISNMLVLAITKHIARKEKK